MKKSLIAALSILIGALLLSGMTVSQAQAADKKGKPQTICPVQGGEIDKSIYTDYKGYRIYFCCKGCPEEFNQDPEKYMKKLRESGVVLEESPKGAAQKKK